MKRKPVFRTSGIYGNDIILDNDMQNKNTHAPFQVRKFRFIRLLNFERCPLEDYFQDYVDNVDS